MTLSKRGDYVVRSAIALARAYDSGEHRKIREVVAEMDVPQTFASQILADLVRADLATSRAGKSGGYRLIRSPDEVSLLEVVEAGEGPLRSQRCAVGDGPCRWERVCPLHETWTAATEALRRTLGETKLSDVVARDDALADSSYPTPSDTHRHGATALELEDWVTTNVTLDECRRRLADGAKWLPSCVTAGYEGADELRRGVDAAGPSWRATSTPAVVARWVDGEVEVTWECEGSNGRSSRFEGRLRAHAVDGERCEVRISGKFRPPGKSGSAKGSPDQALVDRLSRATLRATLRDVARVLANPS